jgi:DNA primase
MSTIDEIKSRIDITDLVSEAGVQLRHAGKNYTGFCPFHDNKHTPSFVVWPETGTWRCFGQCNEGGDIFKFIMKRENLEFKEALNQLAARAGVEIPAYTKQTLEQKEAYDNLRKLLEDALIFYRRHLLANANILGYLRSKRGLSDASIETFGLGYAPNAWDLALTHFTQRGYAEQDLLEAGLISERESGGYFDRFRNRIMIPIRDENGKMSGFGARIVDPNDVPKFLNSPETPIFRKGSLLYGLDRARKPIRVADQAVIVEGYFDVIALHQAGYENVVSPMGTALTENQLRLLKRFTRKSVLALDPDTAGKIAVLRGLETARQSLSSKVPVFDEAGEKRTDAPELIRFADQLEVEIKVVTLPDDLDPDQIVERNREEWARLIDTAQPIVLHTINSVIARYDLNNPKDKAKIVEQLIPFISNVSDPVERDDYRQRLARMLRVDERALLDTQAQPSRGRRLRNTQSVQKQVAAERPNVAVTVSSSKRAEAYIVGVLFKKPELLYRLDRLLQEYGLIALNAEDFEHTDHQMLFELIRESVEQDKTEQHDFVVESLPESLQSLMQELSAQAEKPQRMEEKLLEDLLRGVIKLRRVAAGENLNQLRFLQEEAHQSGDLRASSYQGLVLQHTRLLRDLDQAYRKMTLKRVN